MDASAFTCPNCGRDGLMFRDYESMIVVTADSALFTVQCPTCASRISCMRRIPGELREEVIFAAIEVGAGMGQVS